MSAPALPPTLRRPWPRHGRRIVVGLLGLYFASMLLLLACEKRLAFIGWSMPKPWLGFPDGANVEEFTVTASDGNSIHAWWLRPRNWSPEKGAMLYLHGNGGNISTCGKTMRKWSKELDTGVLGLDYPGFGHSTGTPTEESCYAAAQAAFDWLVREKTIDSRKIIIAGQSMGGAIATELALRRPSRLLLTSGAFATFPDVAQHQFSWWPVRHLIGLQFDNEGKMSRLEVPVFITHGTADHVVPYSHGKRLYNAAANVPRRFYPTEGHGHSQPKTAEFFEAVRKFLRKTEPKLATSNSDREPA